MKTAQAIFLFFLAFLFAIGCKEKEDDQQQPETVTIYAGNTSCDDCIYKNYNSLEMTATYNVPVTHQIDIDNNGSPDIGFSVSFEGSPGGLCFHNSRVWAIRPDVYIASEQKTDSIVTYTITQAVDTNIQPPPAFDSTRFLYSVNYHDSLQLLPGYNLSIFNSNYPMRIDEGHEIGSALEWISDTLLLSSYDCTEYYYEEGNFLYGFISDYTKGIWNGITDKYTGLQIDGKHGWIRFEVINHSRLLIIESVIAE